MGETDVNKYRNELRATVEVSAGYYEKPRGDYWLTLQGSRGRRHREDISN